MATDDGKRVKYVIRGAVELKDGLTLEEAVAHLRAGVAELRGHPNATADIEVSVPRMTGMKL